MASEPSNKQKDPEDEAGAREKPSDNEDEALRPAREKIPEGEGNLRRRADWFQKRTGGTE